MMSNLQLAIEFLSTHGIQSTVMHDLLGIFCSVKITRHVKNQGDIECKQMMYIANHNDVWFASVNGLGQIDVVIRRSKSIIAAAQALIDFLQLNRTLQYKNAEIQHALFTLQREGCVAELTSATSMELTYVGRSTNDVYTFMVEAEHDQIPTRNTVKYLVVWKEEHWALLVGDSESTVEIMDSSDIVAFSQKVIVNIRQGI